MRESDSMMETTDGMLCMESDYTREGSEEGRCGAVKKGVIEIKKIMLDQL